MERIQFTDAMDTPPPIPNAVIPPPPPAAAPKRSPGQWVFIGCGGCLSLIILGGLCLAGFFWMVMGAIKSTDVYSEAYRKAQNSPQVQEVLGTPVEAGWMFQGSVNYENGAGTADFNVPLTGSKGAGSLVAKADKKVGEAWQYSVLEVQIPGQAAIDLKAPPQPAP